MNMFTDLVKGAKKSAKKTPTPKKSSISDERLDEIMAELFGDADMGEDEPVKKGRRYQEELEKAAELDDDEMDDDEMDDDEMEKGMSRREMMDQVYSMVDDMSDDDLTSFLADRQIKKAQVMAIFEQMPTSDLKELVSAKVANGAEPMSPIKMAKGDDYGYGSKKRPMMKGDEMDDEFDDD